MQGFSVNWRFACHLLPRWRAGAILGCLMLLVGCGSVAQRSGASSDEGTVVDPPVVLENWTFPGSSGQPVSLQDLRGQVVLLFFGYANCPDVCPTTLGEFKQVKRQLDEKASDVAFVFVSVDAKRDTPQALERYMQAFDPAFIGLSGDEAGLHQIAQNYGLYYKLNEPKPGQQAYTVDHSSATYRIDRAGQLRTLYSFGTSASAVVEGIERLLAEPTPQ